MAQGVAQIMAYLMAWICNPLSWLFKTQPTGIADIPEQYLEHTRRIMEQSQRTTSGRYPRPPKFNHSQCRYLADKLKVAVDRAQEFLELLNGRYKTCSTSKDMAEFLGIFRLLYAMAKEAESFIQECCKDVWIPAAVKLTNMSEHVASIGFNLELCAIVFESVCKEWGEIESSLLRTSFVDNVRNCEVEAVEEKASLDKETLLENVKAALLDGSSREDPQLTTYVHKRLGPTGEEFGESDISSVTQMMSGSLGKGSCGSVYKGEWRGVPVAMKVNEDGFSKFEKEVLIQSQLSHPHIVSLYCYAEETIVMELMEEDLCSLIHRLRLKHSHGFPFTALVSVDIMLQIGEGMLYLHEMGIIHRDLKSKNILVRPVENYSTVSEYVLAKIADFGESKKMENIIMDMTFNKGTLRWKAPEMIKSNKKEYDGLMLQHPFKCDIYCFAMVCYEIVSGKLPFSDADMGKIKMKILNGERPKLPNRCPNKLKTMIERCWSPHPGERPGFGEICAELRHLKYVLLMTSLWGKVSRLVQEPSSNWYHSTRIQRLMEMRGEFNNEVEFEIEASKESWSELDPLFDTEDVLEKNRLYFEDVKSRQNQKPGFFRDMDDLVLGEKIAEGGHMEVFRAGENYVVKVFKASMRGEDLERMWSRGMLNAFDRDGPRRSPLSAIHGVTLLTDERFLGRFAIVGDRLWGDLRKLIDQRMMKSGNLGYPFPVDEVFTLMFGIAKDMASLHSESPPILHRDLKASNVLLQGLNQDGPSLKVTVTDFECSQGVIGTGFWRAPELLQHLKDRPLFSSLNFTEQCDVYSYGMTCYEIVTGLVPFEAHPDNDFDSVVNGGRPELPPDLDPMLKAIIERCWHSNPSERPSFDDIVKILSFRCITEA